MPWLASDYDSTCMAQVIEIGGVIDLSSFRGRAILICAVANMYQILHLMAR